MSNLKTLKDLMDVADRPEMVEPGQIKEEAIKWIKAENDLFGFEVTEEITKDDGTKGYEVDSEETIREFIKHFFNITEEDLK